MNRSPGPIVVHDSLHVVVVGDEGVVGLAEVGERAVFLAVLAFLPEPHLHVQGAVHQVSSSRGSLAMNPRIEGRELIDMLCSCPCQAASTVRGYTRQVHDRLPCVQVAAGRRSSASMAERSLPS